MFDVRELNVAIEAWGVAFCIVGIICSLLLVRREGPYRRLLVSMFALELLAACGDATSIYCAGNLDGVSRMLSFVGNLATYVCTFFLQATVSSYICCRCNEAGGKPYHAWRIGVNVAAVVMSVFAASGAVFFYDDLNIYHRGDWFWVSLAFVTVASAVNALIVVANRSHIDTSTLVCLLFYTLAPIVASAIQGVIYGPNLAIAVGVIGLVVVFLEMQVHSARRLVAQAEALARSEAAAAQSRIAVTVAQMQPHFLFNTLDTIYGLVGEDDDAAREAIASFSSYLRTNLASLNRTTPVPIETEIRHVRTYLELERTSDPDRVTYEIDIAATGFSVPALSVQTLAENAVKHGIGAKVEGGTVTVRTRELPGEFTVAVADDGVGFDVDVVGEGEMHIGLQNTRTRLATMCDGALEITSEPGIGTVAVMHIPK